MSCTHSDANQDHLYVAEHLRDAKENVQKDGHELRETGIVTVRANTDRKKMDSLPAGRKQVQSRLLQVVKHQPACVGEKVIRPR
jgi:hypothetical protein